jgi:ferredoxin
VTIKRDALPEAKEFDGKPGKLTQLSKKPGQGD